MVIFLGGVFFGVKILVDGIGVVEEGIGFCNLRGWIFFFVFLEFFLFFEEF